jgi:hypothetical protein
MFTNGVHKGCLQMVLTNDEYKWCLEMVADNGV